MPQICRPAIVIEGTDGEIKRKCLKKKTSSGKKRLGPGLGDFAAIATRAAKPLRLSTGEPEGPILSGERYRKKKSKILEIETVAKIYSFVFLKLLKTSPPSTFRQPHLLQQHLHTSR
jgi:hypothetical protein